MLFGCGWPLGYQLVGGQGFEPLVLAAVAGVTSGSGGKAMLPRSSASLVLQGAQMLGRISALQASGIIIHTISRQLSHSLLGARGAAHKGQTVQTPII